MKIASVLILFLTTFLSYGQIQVGGEQPKEKKEKEKKETSVETVDTTKKISGDSEVFFGVTWANTFRALETNNNVFGDSIGKRANETSMNTWSYSLGIRSKINNYLMWEGGISFMSNGEEYSDVVGDSSYSYSTKYNYIGMPLKLYFTYGSKLQLRAGIGLVPQMTVKSLQRIDYRTSGGNEVNSETKTKIGYNSFVLSALGTIGVHYQFSPRFGAYFMPEYRRQLSSSYLKTNKFKHYGTSLGFQFGLTLKF